MEIDLGRVLDALPAMVWTALPDGHIDFVNRRWSEYTGLSLDNAHGWEWQAAIKPDDLPKLLERWRSILTSGQPGEMEAPIRRFDGQYRWFLIQCSPMHDDAGRIIKWCGVAADVEDFRRAEETLRRRELDFQLIVDSIPVPVAVTTPSGEVEGLNQPTLNYFGKTFEELKGWKASDVVHPDDLEHTVSAQLEAHQKGSAYAVESRHRRADGVYRWYNVRGFPLRDPQGHILRWFHLLIDIDDRKRAEEALRESEREARLIVNSIPAGIEVLTPSGQVEAVNEHIVRYFGRTAEELKHRGMVDFIHPEDLQNVLDTALHSTTTGEPYYAEQRFRGADGTYRWFQVRGLPQRDANGRIVRWYALHIDIDDRKRAEEALSNARSELAHVARVSSLGALTASIAHEVNQPLSGIITNAGTCLRMLAADPPNVEGARETARRTIRDGNRAADVITRLRALFSKRATTIEPVNLNEAAREVIALSWGDLQRSQVVVRTEFADGLPLVNGNRVQLQQVIMNMLRNAADAMSGVDDRPRRLVIRTEPGEDDHVRLTVQDAGVGFRPEGVEQLFEAFYTTKSDGMGIGLSISRSIIESHHGRLWAAANDGPGATFAFSIPAYSGDEAPAHDTGAAHMSVTAIGQSAAGAS